MPRVIGSGPRRRSRIAHGPGEAHRPDGDLAQPRALLAIRTQPSPIAYQFLGRFDLITIWVTVLLAVGLYVTGKVSKGRATIFGVLMWLIGALPALRQAYMSM